MEESHWPLGWAEPTLTPVLPDDTQHPGSLGAWQELLDRVLWMLSQLFLHRFLGVSLRAVPSLSLLCPRVPLRFLSQCKMGLEGAQKWVN